MTRHGGYPGCAHRCGGQTPASPLSAARQQPRQLGPTQRLLAGWSAGRIDAGLTTGLLCSAGCRQQEKGRRRQPPPSTSPASKRWIEIGKLNQAVHACRQGAESADATGASLARASYTLLRIRTALRGTTRATSPDHAKCMYGSRSTVSLDPSQRTRGGADAAQAPAHAGFGRAGCSSPHPLPTRARCRSSLDRPLRVRAALLAALLTALLRDRVLGPSLPRLPLHLGRAGGRAQRQRGEAHARRRRAAQRDRRGGGRAAVAWLGLGSGLGLGMGIGLG